MATILRQRRDTASNWTSANPVIPDGQLCFDTTNDTFRIGDGTATYGSLPIQSGEAGDMDGSNNLSEVVSASTARTNLGLAIGTDVGYLNIPKSGASKTASYTLATTDIGELIEVGASGAITIPDATFSTGDVILIFNNTTGDVTLTCSITTAYIGGTNTDEASMTLATRGICNVLFISSTVCVVTGNVT